MGREGSVKLVAGLRQEEIRSGLQGKHRPRAGGEERIDVWAARGGRPQRWRNK